jgi:hypothetical protein
MGLLDQLKKNLPGLKKKAEDLVEEHDDKIKDGLDKAATLANEKTGGKHRDKIEKGVAKAKDAVDDLAEPDDEPGPTARQTTKKPPQ